MPYWILSLECWEILLSHHHNRCLKSLPVPFAAAAQSRGRTCPLGRNLPSRRRPSVERNSPLWLPGEGPLQPREERQYTKMKTTLSEQNCAKLRYSRFNKQKRRHLRVCVSGFFLETFPGRHGCLVLLGLDSLGFVSRLRGRGIARGWNGTH